MLRGNYNSQYRNLNRTTQGIVSPRQVHMRNQNAILDLHLRKIEQAETQNIQNTMLESYDAYTLNKLTDRYCQIKGVSRGQYDCLFGVEQRTYASLEANYEAALEFEEALINDSSNDQEEKVNLKSAFCNIQ